MAKTSAMKINHRDAYDWPTHPSFLDSKIMKQVIEPEKVIFDCNGQWIHSAFMAENLSDEVPLYEYASAKGLYIQYVRYKGKRAENGPTDLSKWNVKPPTGDGWFPVAFTENYEYVFAVFVRKEK